MSSNNRHLLGRKAPWINGRRAGERPAPAFDAANDQRKGTETPVRESEVSDDEQNLLAVYRRLHKGLSDMIEGGRLTEAEIPDDYQWLVLMLRRATDIAAEGE